MAEQDRLVAGRFRLIRRLGAGAMASVFLAEDGELGRRVAIKRLHPDTSSTEVASRFRREMRVAASLSHPNIVTLYDAIEHDGDVLLVMELVDGPTLAQRMGGGPIEPETALRILRGIAAAVDHLHGRGVVHRDVKPANILLDQNGTPKLTDLGIASAAHATGITTTGTMLGTPAYMAPELFDGDRATPAADVYSVAAIAFEMLTGRRARGGGTPAMLAMRAATEPPPDLREDWPDAGPLADALARGMARDPAQRPRSATALVDEIASGLAEREPPATAPRAAAGPPEPERDRRAPAALLVGVAALALVALVAVVIAGGGGSGGDRRSAATRERTTTTSRSPSARRTSTASSTAARAATPAASPGTPAGAVQAFYGRAAAHRYGEAWTLAAPSLRSQLQGFEAFRRQFSSVRSIVFSRASTVSRGANAATVAIATTTRHTDRTDHCTGTAETAPGSGGGWLVTHIAISC